MSVYLVMYVAGDGRGMVVAVYASLDAAKARAQAVHDRAWKLRASPGQRPTLAWRECADEPGRWEAAQGWEIHRREVETS